MEKFILRALNHSRSEFLATYIALRMFVDANQHQKLDVKKFLNRKSSSQSSSLYKHYQIFKNELEGGQIEYRTAHAASPIALLAECYALDLMRADRAFHAPDNVFSYRFSDEWSNYIWKYYFEGFKERNIEVTNKLVKHSGCIAVSVDIRQFYPSVKGKYCLEMLFNLLQKSAMSQDEEKFVFRTAERAVTAAGYSLPIGPPIGHALGNIFLSDFDKLMIAHYGNMYFRYVDDMVIVVPQDSKEEVVDFVSDALNRIGLSLHPAKTETYNVSSWISKYPRSTEEDGFAKLRSRLMTYLAADRSKEKVGIDDLLATAGFNIPLSRMRFGAQSSGFLSRLRRQLMGANWLRPLGISSEKILSEATSLRENILNTVRSMMPIVSSSHYDSNSVIIKRHVNNVILLCYMHPLRDLENLLQFVPSRVEFHALKCLIECCASGDATAILSYPGRFANVFAQLWSESNVGLANIDVQGGVKIYQRDALSVLILYNVVRVPLSSFKDFDLEDREFLAFCLGEQMKSRMLRDLSYVDEIRSLQRTFDREKTIQYLLRRVDAEDELMIEMDVGTMAS